MRYTIIYINSFTFIGKDFIPDPDFINAHLK